MAHLHGLGRQRLWLAVIGEAAALDPSKSGQQPPQAAGEHPESADGNHCLGVGGSLVRGGGGSDQGRSNRGDHNRSGRGVGRDRGFDFCRLGGRVDEQRSFVLGFRSRELKLPSGCDLAGVLDRVSVGVVDVHPFLGVLEVLSGQPPQRVPALHNHRLAVLRRLQPIVLIAEVEDHLRHHGCRGFR